MHKIYGDKGNYNYLYQIPQILYSSIISWAIKKLLKKLALSEDNILSIRKEKNIKKVFDIEYFIKIKFILFFAIGIIFMLFFSYFISCFCAIYKNTQIILIENTLMCFCLNLTYPFILNLSPGLFRIPALHAKNKDKICLYKFSNLLAII